MSNSIFNMVAGYLDEPVCLSYSLQRFTPLEGIFRYKSRLTLQITVIITRHNFIRRFHCRILFLTPVLTPSKTGDSLRFILNELNCDAGVPVLYLHIYHVDSCYLLECRSIQFV